METTCIHISIYSRIPRCACNERVRTFRTIPHAGDSDADVVCSIWNSGGKDEWEVTKVVPYSTDIRSFYMFGLELVQIKRQRHDIDVSDAV